MAPRLCSPKQILLLYLKWSLIPRIAWVTYRRNHWSPDSVLTLFIGHFSSLSPELSSHNECRRGPDRERVLPRPRAYCVPGTVAGDAELGRKPFSSHPVILMEGRSADRLLWQHKLFVEGSFIPTGVGWRSAHQKSGISAGPSRV